jgi:radical SAM superfamily enzyme YgiQ (UPF0313 family)
MTNTAFLPTSREDMRARGWYYYDFLLITGDAYVDHPASARPLSARFRGGGFRVAVLAQPDWKSANDFLAVGRPRYAALVGPESRLDGCALYAAKKPRGEDYYSLGKRPACGPTAPSLSIPQGQGSFCDLPVIIGGLEASLRRFSTTIIGKIRCGGRFCLTPKPTCLSTAWVKTP